MPSSAPAPSDDRSPSGASWAEGDLGWGGRDWAEGGRSYESADSSGDADDPDLERLRADRPPHHEERER